MTEPVVITGIGVVESDLDTPREPKIRAGVPAPASAAVVDPRFPSAAVLSPRVLRKVSDLTCMCTVAASQALVDAGLDGEGKDLVGDETGVSLGTCFGSSSYHLEYHEDLRRDGMKAASALLFSQSVFNAASGHIGQVFGLRGSNLGLVGGEQVGLDAVRSGWRRVALGDEVASLAGGGEQYCDLVSASLAAMSLIGADGQAPRFAEGAAVLVVERESQAAQRGATVRARLLPGRSARGPSALQRVAEALGAADVVVGCPPAGDPADWLDAGLGQFGPAWRPSSVVERGAGFAFGSARAVVDGVEALGAGAQRVVVLSGSVRGAVSGLVLEAL